MSPVNSLRLPVRQERKSAWKSARKMYGLQTGYRPAMVPAKLAIARLYLLHICRARHFIACNREFFASSIDGVIHGGAQDAANGENQMSKPTTTETTDRSIDRRHALGFTTGLLAAAAAMDLPANAQPAAATKTAVTPVARTVTDAECEQLFKQVSNWGVWGPNDQRGTLNHIGPQEITAAAATVKLGQTVSLSRNFPTRAGIDNSSPAAHFMTQTGDNPCTADGCVVMSGDFISINVHGMAASHMDALCHMFKYGKSYNGYPAAEVTSSGAPRNNIMTNADGVVGRGVLLDPARAKGIPYYETHQLITVADLEAAEKAHKVTVGKGDLVMIRTGRDARTKAVPGQTELRIAGLDPQVAAWLHARKASVLGGDGVHDSFPFNQLNKSWPNPVHVCLLASAGMQLLDNLSLEPVADQCAKANRWAFLLTLAPLRIERGTGSPLNPIAVF